VDPFGSGEGPAAGCCVHGDEPSGSGATELVTYEVVNLLCSKRPDLVSDITLAELSLLLLVYTN
jgi:hypothetical protein